MQELIELLRISRKGHPNSASNIYIKKEKEKEKEKVAIFLTGIDNGDFKNDTEACLALYQNKIHPKYNMLKSRVKNILLQAVYLSRYEINHSADIDNIEDKLKKMSSIAFITYSEGYTFAALEIYRYIFRKSAESYLYNIINECSHVFTKLLAYHNKLSEFTKVQEIIKTSRKWLSIEQELDDAISEESMKNYNGQDRNNVFFENAKKLKRFKNLAVKSKDPNFKINVILYEYVLLTGNYDVKQITFLVNEALKIIKSNYLEIRIQKRETFITISLGLQLVLKDYVLMKKNLDNNAELSESKIFWWQYYLFKTCYLLHTDAFEEAYNAFLQIIDHPLYKELPLLYIENTLKIQKIICLLFEAKLIKKIHPIILNIIKNRSSENLNISMKKYFVSTQVLKLTEAICYKNIPSAITILKELQHYIIKNPEKITHRNNIIINAFDVFLQNYPNINIALKSGKLIIQNLKEDEIFDDDELIPVNKYWEFVELIYKRQPVETEF